MKEQIDIGIITVLPTEIQSIIKALQLSTAIIESENGSLRYFKGSFYSDISERNITVALAYLNKEAGNTEAAITTQQFISDWYPKIMCLVGIAAGLKGCVKIADVVIPNKVIDMTIKTFKQNDYRPRSTSYQRLDMIDSDLKRNSISNQEFSEICHAELNDEIHRAITTATIMGFSENEFDGNISIHDGSLWSDNILIRDSSFFDSHGQFDDRCRGGEMESAGFIRACQFQRYNLPWLVFRGISDFGDDRKGDEFQLLAAQCAAIAFRETFKKRIDVDRIENDPRVSTIEQSLQIDIIKQIRDAYHAQRWGEVCRIAPIISRFLWTSGQYELRIELGKKVIEAAKNTNDDATRCAYLVDDLGWTLYAIDAGHKNEAISNIKDGLRIAKEIKDFYVCAKAHRHLASIARREKNYKLAGEELNKAKTHAKKIKNSEKKAEIDATLVFSFLKLSIESESYGECWEEEANEAIKRFKELGDKDREVKVYNYIGKLYLKQGLFTKAQNGFKQGLQLAYQIDRYDAIKDNTLELLDMLNEESEQREVYVNRAIEFCKAHKLFAEISYWKKSIGGDISETLNEH